MITTESICRNNKGMSLVEMLVTLVIVTAVVSGSSYGVYLVMKHQLRVDSKIQAENSISLAKKLGTMATAHVSLSNFESSKTFTEAGQPITIAGNRLSHFTWNVPLLLGGGSGGFVRGLMGTASSLTNLEVFSDAGTLNFFKVIKVGAQYRKALKSLIISRCIPFQRTRFSSTMSTIDETAPVSSAVYALASLNRYPKFINVGGRPEVRCCRSTESAASCSGGRTTEWLFRIYKIGLDDNDRPVSIQEFPQPQEAKQTLNAGFELTFDNPTNPSVFKMNMFFQENLCNTMMANSADSNCRGRVGQQIFADANLYKDVVRRHTRVRTLSWTGKSSVPLESTGVINLGF